MSFDETTIRQAYEFAEACRRATVSDAALVILVKSLGKDSQSIQVPCVRHDADQKKMSTAVADSMLFALSEFFGDEVEVLIRSKQTGKSVTAEQFVGASRSETIKVER